jgi:hypothetical protein
MVKVWFVSAPGLSGAHYFTTDYTTVQEDIKAFTDQGDLDRLVIEEREVTPEELADLERNAVDDFPGW